MPRKAGDRSNPNRRPGKASAKPASAPTAQLVLIADDSADNREMYAQNLSFLGYRTAEAANGREAIGVAVAMLPDVIVMDLSMPVVDGWQAIVALRLEPRTRGIPVIALSGFTMSDERRRAEAAGASLFLTRPCLPEDLARHIQTLLERRPGRR